MASELSNNWRQNSRTEPAGGLTVDGSFGAYTNEATRNFQACVHISVDGIIGPNTWSKLNYWVNQSTYACG